MTRIVCPLEQLNRSEPSCELFCRTVPLRESYSSSLRGNTADNRAAASLIIFAS
jgi:hypothetical protein